MGQVRQYCAQLYTHLCTCVHKHGGGGAGLCTSVHKCAQPLGGCGMFNHSCVHLCTTMGQVGSIVHSSAEICAQVCGRFVHSGAHICVHLCTTTGEVGHGCVQLCTQSWASVHNHGACGALLCKAGTPLCTFVHKWANVCTCGLWGQEEEISRKSDSLRDGKGNFA